MNRTRSQIDAALLAQLQRASWGSPPVTWNYVSMHLVHWDKFDPGNQPAVFLRRITEDPRQVKAYGQTKYLMDYEVWIYLRVNNVDTSSNPYLEFLDPVIDAVDAILAAHPVTSRNTLGNLVDNCYISGRIQLADGSDDGQAVIFIPVAVLTGI